MKYTLEGKFNTGDVYNEEFFDKESFQYTMKQILNNPTCEAPERLITKQAPEKLPKYLKEAATKYNWRIESA